MNRTAEARWEAWKDCTFNELRLVLANRSCQQEPARATSHLGPETTASNDAELERCISGKYTTMRQVHWPLCLSKLKESVKIKGAHILACPFTCDK